MTCPKCSKTVSNTADRCPACGTEIDFSATPTLTGFGERSTPSFVEHPAAKGSSGFTPGTTIAGRYRIATLLGKGGMGEVYRADDLTLNQPVAMKFLPRTLAADPDALARFHAEVRVARQIAHSSVCRVFDIGEAEGRLFLTMEYIDGEDLTSLLRRIGRLPADKALELARQICAGVAAAHGAGVLHRDLKPANVMIDGRGRAHITDFGVAGMAAELQHDLSRAGTPAYMAPEQLAGKGVSIQSDLFSLGLILYEMFTGKRAFEASTIQDLMRVHDSAPSRPSTHVGDMDPLVERIILRCLERDPALRPRSALDVARALPGGDPLAAALAAGETPSPEMVAASGGEGALEVRQAWTLLGGLVLTIAAIFGVARYSSDLALAPIDKSLEMLAERAQSIIRKAGYSNPPADYVDSINRNGAFLSYHLQHLPPGQSYRDLAQAAQTPKSFFYRQSPRPLSPRHVTAIVSLSDPPMDVTGMVYVILTTRGDLLSFVAVPPQAVKPGEWTASHPAPDWNAFFADAGLDPARFQPEEPVWSAPVPYDSRAGWTGTYAQSPADQIHIAAAAFQGQPVYFSVTGPWSSPGRDRAAGQSASASFTQRSWTVVQLVTLSLALYLAYRNWRLGRGDQKGALRLGGIIFTTQLAALLLAKHYVSDTSQEWGVFIDLLGRAVWIGVLAMIPYLAIEPYLRRRWPEVLTSWARLMSCGGGTAPLVGRDVLKGACLGALLALASHIRNALPVWLPLKGEVGLSPQVTSASEFLANILQLVNESVASALFPMLIIFALLVVTRKQWRAELVALVLFTILAVGNGNPTVGAALGFFGAALMVYAGSRLGILSLAAFEFYEPMLRIFPMTLDPSRWYFSRTVVVLGICMGIAIWAFRVSLGGKSPLGSLALDSE